jgi:hypothetical protein
MSRHNGDTAVSSTLYTQGVGIGHAIHGLEELTDRFALHRLTQELLDRIRREQARGLGLVGETVGEIDDEFHGMLLPWPLRGTALDLALRLSAIDEGVEQMQHLT